MSKKKNSASLFDTEDFLGWKKEWQDMPEFKQEQKEPLKQLIVSFETWDDYKEFEKLIKQRLTKKTQSIWFPKVKIDTYMDKRYTTKK
jgi:hypothetical protein